MDTYVVEDAKGIVYTLNVNSQEKLNVSDACSRWGNPFILFKIKIIVINVFETWIYLQTK